MDTLPAREYRLPGLSVPSAMEAKPAPEDNQRKRLTLGAVVLATFLSTFDSNAVNLALPTIAEEFPGDAARLAWVVNGYVLPYAITFLIAGRLGDMLGRRRVFIAGALLFALSALGSVLAPSLELLIASRVFQGIGGSIQSVTATAILAATFTGPARSKALGVQFAAGPIGVLVGPLVGGALAAWFGWHAIFSVQVVLALLIASIAYLRILETPLVPRSFDLAGIVAGTLFVVSLNVALLKSAAWGWTSPRVMAVWACACVGLLLFLVREQTAADPAIRLKIFRSRNFVAACVAGAAAWFVIQASFIQLSVYLQRGRGIGPLEAALVMAPGAIGGIIGSLNGSAVVRRFGSRRVAVVGLLIVCVTTAWCATFGETTPYAIVALVSMLRGATMATVLLSSTVDALSEFSPADLGMGASTLSCIRQIGASLGVALPAAAFDMAARGALSGPGVFAGVRLAFDVTLGVLVVATVITWLVLPRKVALQSEQP